MRLKRNRAIYKKYVRDWDRFRNGSDKAFKDFLLELKRLYEKGIRLISTDDLYYYIRRHSFFLVSSSGFKNEWKAKPRMYYFKFWIRRAEGGGFIIKRGLGWEISKKIMRISKFNIGEDKIIIEPKEE